MKGETAKAAGQLAKTIAQSHAFGYAIRIFWGVTGSTVFQLLTI